MTDAVRVDTGHVDSNHDLGINARKEDSLLYRRVSECAVLKQEGYVTGWLTEPPDAAPLTNGNQIEQASIPGDLSKYYYYGHYEGYYNDSLGPGHNYTYRYNNYSNAAISLPYIVWTSPYMVNESQEQPWLSPIPALNQTGGDITLVIVENRAIYMQPTHDPLFAATKNTSGSVQSQNWGFSQTFAPDREVGIVGCTERYQICNPVGGFKNASPHCSEPGGLAMLPNSTLLNGVEVPSNGAESLKMNQKQLATLRRLQLQFSNEGVGIGPLNLGQDALNASTLLFGAAFVFSLGLPANQWQYEVLYWHKISLAMLQKAVLDFVLGPSIAAFNQYVTPARDPSNGNYYGAMCDQQKSLSPFHTNFSALGVILILVLGTLIAILNLTVAQLMDRKRVTAQLCWEKDETLELQALGYQIAGIRTWRVTKHKDEEGKETNPKHGKQWWRIGFSSEKYPRTVTAEALPSLHQCVDERRRDGSESAPSSIEEAVVEVKHDEPISASDSGERLMASSRTW